MRPIAPTQEKIEETPGQLNRPFRDADRAHDYFRRAGPDRRAKPCKLLRSGFMRNAQRLEVGGVPKRQFHDISELFQGCLLAGDVGVVHGGHIADRGRLGGLGGSVKPERQKRRERSSQHLTQGRLAQRRQ